MRAGAANREPDTRAGKLALVREALAEAIENSSLREVARQVGMSPTGLQGMIDGADPYAKTWDKILAWYAAWITNRPRVRASRAFDAATMAGLLDLLLREVPEPRRGDARARVLRGFVEAFSQGGVTAPAWLAELGATPRRVRI